MGKKHVRLWNRSILMSEIGVRPKLRCWAKMRRKQTRKIGLNELLRNDKKKKTIQAFESLNSDGRATIEAQLTISGQDQQETDAKNRTSTNLASQLTNPLELKKTF